MALIFLRQTGLSRPYKNVFWYRYWLSIKKDSMYVGVNVLQHFGMEVQTNCPMIFFWGIPLLSNRRWVGCNIVLPTYWKNWHSFLIRFIVAKVNWNCVYRRHVTYIHMFIGDILLMGLIIWWHDIFFNKVSTRVYLLKIEFSKLYIL